MKNYKYKRLCAMIDMSRNSVMNVPSLKQYIVLLKKMGYNSVMLYTEDTYEVKDEPYFGYMRGRYSQSELKDIDSYARSLGMELIPCVQTLAHLNATIRWGKVPVDCNDILLVDDPHTYEFIDNLFATISDCFSSKLVHIGMDEAWMLGRGRHLDIHGYENSTEIIGRHLSKVKQIAQKYGFKCLMWSDMFFNSWANGYYQSKTDVPQYAIDAVDKGVSLVYWDYYHTKEEEYDGMFYNHKQLSDDVWFAGGAWSWLGVTPLNQFTLQTMLPAMRSCRKNGIKNVIITLWGDFGGECSHFSQLASLFCIAQYLRGIEDEQIIKTRFKRIVGVDFDDFMLLDSANRLKGVNAEQNPSRYMLYSDYFNGFLDYTVDISNVQHYKDSAEKLHALAKKYRKYSYIFDPQAKLCDVLSYKYALGVRTRKAYENKDKELLRSLANNDYVCVTRALRAFHKALQKQWFKDNKTSGFDVQDLRLGGIIQRTISCRQRILDYVNGKIEKIEELEETLLPFGGKEQGEAISFNNIAQIMTTNVYN